MEISTPNMQMDQSSIKARKPLKAKKSIKVRNNKRKNNTKVNRLKNKKIKVQSIPKKQKFFFLPTEVTQKTRWKLYFFPFSSVKAIQHLEDILSGKTFTFQETDESKKELEICIRTLVDLRWKFRRLVLAWRYKNCKAANEFDPITMEPIQDCIKIYNIPLKMYYQFEAKSLSEYWRISLKESDGLIPTPKWPRNPLTNLPIYKKTLYTISEFLLSKGYTDSFLASLTETKFNMILWKSMYQIPLRLNAVKNTFSNKRSYDCLEYTYDYIELQCQIHSESFNKPFYDWIFYKRKKPQIEEKAKVLSNQWINYCKDFHEKDILNPERSEFSKELAKTYPLIKNLLKATSLLYRFYYESISERRNALQNFAQALSSSSSNT
jgi:hypothetical protein